MMLDVQGVAVWLPGVVAIGALVGGVAGLFGVGGGFLLTPALVVLFDVPLQTAVGTGLCLVVGTSTSALLRHRAGGRGELRIDALLLAGALLGPEAGTRLLGALAEAGDLTLPGVGPRPAVRVAVEGTYALVLGGLALLVWRKARTQVDVLRALRPGPLAAHGLGPRLPLPGAGLSGVPTVTTAWIGALLGVLSGLLGIGAGVVLNPILLFGFGLPVQQVVATGLVPLLASAAAGTVSHASRGHVHLGLACALLAGSTIAAQFGALATRRLPASALARANAALMLLGAGAVLWDVLARSGARP